MYQPYQFQGYQPQYQPSLPSMPNNGLIGHVVGSHEEIKPQDVPMNGNAAYFPAQDGSVIYAKAWNQNGSISTVRYVPENVGEQVQQPTLIDVMNQLSDIQDILKAQPAKPAAKRTTKKETENE